MGSCCMATTRDIYNFQSENEMSTSIKLASSIDTKSEAHVDTKSEPQIDINKQSPKNMEKTSPESVEKTSPESVVNCKKKNSVKGTRTYPDKHNCVIFHYMVIIYGEYNKQYPGGHNKQYHGGIGLYNFKRGFIPYDWCKIISSGIKFIVNGHNLPINCRWRLNIHAINSCILTDISNVDEYDYIESQY